jgi:bifunctional non-homologous end joining protein LigD
VKFDGYRIACRIDGKDVRLISRNGKDWTSDFPEVREAAAHLQVRRAFLDGELAVMLPDGRTSFQGLQNVIGSAPPRDLVYFVFDLLHLNGQDIARLPLERRKARLKRLLQSPGSTHLIHYTDHVIGRGPEFFQQACRHGLEGIVSKRRDLPYRAGRSRFWLKAKCVKRQEFVIGGFTDPAGSRLGIGALLLGVYDPAGSLLFAGKVGTGFAQKNAQVIRHRLDPLQQNECPFATPPEGRLLRGTHWVRPALVAEVVFTEWTDDGKIRQPSFQGLRADKSPKDVHREEPASTPSASGRGGKGALGGG